MKLGLVSKLCLLVTARDATSEAAPDPSSLAEKQRCSDGATGDVVASWVRAGMCKSNSCLLASSCFTSSLYTNVFNEESQTRGCQRRRGHIRPIRCTGSSLGTNGSIYHAVDFIIVIHTRQGVGGVGGAWGRGRGKGAPQTALQTAHLKCSRHTCDYTHSHAHMHHCASHTRKVYIHASANPHVGALPGPAP